MAEDYQVSPELMELTEEKLEKIGQEHIRISGSNYFRENRVKNPMVWGKTIVGEIGGSSHEAYKIQVDVTEEKITSTCNCPYNGNYCKHAFALLYAWIRAQNTFKRLENIEFILSKKSNYELTTILLGMVKKDPRVIQELHIDEKYLYETSQEKSKRYEDFYRVSSQGIQQTQELLERLKKFYSTAANYMNQENYHDAAKVLQAIILKGLEKYSEVDDSTGILSDFLEECIRLYSGCLSRTLKTLEEKKDIFKQIFELYIKEIHGFAHSMMELIAGNCTVHLEYQFVEEMCKGRLTGFYEPNQVIEHETREKIIELLLELYHREGKDDKFLSLAKQEINSWHICLRLCDKLESLNRIDEAVRYYKRAVEEGTGKYPKLLMQKKLAELYENHNQKEKALETYISYFDERDDLEIYEKIKKLSNELQTWENVRNKMLISLSKAGKCHTLIDALLKEGDINSCIKLAMMPNQSTKDIDKVADAIKTVRPKDSITLFKKLINYYISLKRREDYKVAAEYLKDVKDIYSQLDEKQTWEKYIKRLIKQNATKKVLVEEISLFV
ncbi:SWIM zinc finger family protein [Candidatus Desantisbacteria bacterium]|nr:SWIM zinc finger family protein [Candidatus Desantisbacteria bacterium]